MTDANNGNYSNHILSMMTTMGHCRDWFDFHKECPEYILESDN